MFDRITPDGVEWDDPDARRATAGSAARRTSRRARSCGAPGSGPSLDHLAPLGLRAPGGGIVMDGTQVVADPRVQLVGYGPSASTVGANRAGREAARNLPPPLGQPG